ncbi:MAG: AraC family transcriptional regulator [Solirubrobacteraceae bacterium]|nr:transcriptional regulator, AraC family [Solirubrobacterales bacterium]MEA2215905.1 AraC family transcriptional regulator [Solirubrobacteraceae bacterium]
MLDFAHCYAAITAKDGRFDGWFITAVTSTGVYCRPSCPARTPKQENVRFLPTAAAAQAAGFRACKRCRPDAAPGSPDWDTRADLVGRAMRLIAGGVVEREGVNGLAARLGYSERHLHRCLLQALGAGPLALARAQRAQTARVLLETSDLGIGELALTAGFASVRQFNTTMRQVFDRTPRELRAGRTAGASGGAAGAPAGGVTVRLAYRTPFDGAGLLAFLAARAVPGVEQALPGGYRRSLSLPRGEGVVELTLGQEHVRATFWLEDLRDLGAAISRSRRLLDLDSDPHSILKRLGGDPVIGALVRDQPGRRVPGHTDGAELAIRAVLGQQVSLAGARTLAGRLVSSWGKPLVRPVGEVTHLFPSPVTLAALDAADLPLPRARGATLVRVASAVASGELVLDEGADRAQSVTVLLSLPGIGPWTAGYVAMRALGDPDAFPAGDLGVRRALESLRPGVTGVDLEGCAELWRPYRAYATQHLWASLAGALPRTPAARGGRRLELAA